MATAKQPKAAGPATKGLKISAKREKFYSGGITQPFGYEPRTIPLSDLTPEQAEELIADPWLVVEEVEIKADKA